VASELAAHEVAGPLRRDEADVDLGAGVDQVVVDREAVREHEQLAGRDPVADLGLPDLGLLLVRQQDHHHVAAAGRLGDRLDREAVLLGLVDRIRALTQADDDLDAGVLEVERVGMALGAVAEDGHGLAVEEREVGVVVVDHGRAL
jgi:hypothetical protein